MPASQSNPHDQLGEAVRPPAAVVLLEHALPDGTIHYDWLVARNGPGDAETRDVRTFRCAGRVDRLEVGQWCACEPIEDHRRRYLTYEGLVEPGRGRVRRVASGVLTRWMTVTAVTTPGGCDPIDLCMAWTTDATSTAVERRYTIRPLDQAWQTTESCVTSTVVVVCEGDVIRPCPA